MMTKLLESMEQGYAKIIYKVYKFSRRATGIFCARKNAKPFELAKFYNIYFQPSSLTSNSSLSFEAKDLKV